MRFLVLGGGAQGSAAAFHLAGRPEVDQVVVADQRVDRLPAFLREPVEVGRVSTVAVDAGRPDAVLAAMAGMDAVLCALPYYLNLEMTRLALRAGAHFCDLGGNTEIVESQRALDGEAREKGLSVVPDCGLAPGMVNILAQAGIEALEEVDSVRIRVGGLPQSPEPPLDYQIVYSLHGVLDYYTTEALVLEDGEPTGKESLTGLETVEFPEPVGTLEAFYTAGGISTLPHRYRGRIRSMDYKTLRYPGHARIMKAIRDLGLLDSRPVRVGNVEVAPRDVFIEAASPRLRKPESPDLVAMRVEVEGRRNGAGRRIRYELLDRFDEEHGVTAMMRSTGYSLAITSVMQADGRIGPGVHTPDEAVSADAYVRELARAGVRIERSES